MLAASFRGALPRATTAVKQAATNSPRNTSRYFFMARCLGVKGYRATIGHGLRGVKVASGLRHTRHSGSFARFHPGRFNSASVEYTRPLPSSEVYSHRGAVV